MTGALRRQDGWLIATEAFFLTLIGVELLRGDAWGALAAFAALGACLIVPAVRQKSRFSLPVSVDRATAALVFSTIFLGERLDFYDRFWWWDTAAHGIAGALLCYLGAILFDQMTRHDERKNTLLRLTFVLSFSIAAAGLWEVVEYLLDQVFDSDAQRGSLDDTMTDILAHVIGATLAVLSLHPRWSRRRSGQPLVALREGPRGASSRE